MIKHSNKLQIIKSLFVILFIVVGFTANAQWMLINQNGGSPDASAALELQSTNKGFLAPRMTTTQMNSVSSPATGLLIYNTDSVSFYYYNGISGAWTPIFSSTSWTKNGSDVYHLNGRVGIGTSTPFGLLTLNGDSSNLLTIKSTDNAKNNGLAFQNASNKYSWTMKRVNSATTNFPDLVIAGGNVSTNVASLNERIRFTNDGLVGIGEATPDSLLTVGGGIMADYIRLTAGAGANKVLTSDASGGASWQTPSSGGDNLGNHKATQILQLSGNKISNDGGNEGISVDNNGQATFTPASTGAGNLAVVTNGDVRTTGLGTGYYLTNTNIGITGNNGNSGDMRFKTNGNDRIRILGGGQVGIGTNSPQVPLHIQGGNDASLNATNGYLVLGNTNSTNLVFDNNEILARDNGATSFLALNANGGAISMHAGINDVNRWGVFFDDGNFILGDTLTANRTKLRVAGRVLADTLAVLNGVQFPLDKGTNGQVLTSNGSGLATWLAVPSSADNLGNHTATTDLLMANKKIRNIESLDIGATSLNGIIGVLGDGRNTINMQAIANTTSLTGLSWQNQNGDYVWSIHRENNGTGDADLVFAGGLNNSSVASLNERMRITMDGNFGIGTNSPKNKLHINSSTSATKLQLTNSTSGSAAGDGFLLSSDATNGLISNQESGDIEFNTNSADRMVIKSDGKVGMGIMSPKWNLHVHNAGTNTSFIQLTNSSTGSTANDGLEIGQSGTQTFIRNQENSNLKLGTNNTIRLTISGAGDVGIGTTAPVRTFHLHDASSSGNYMQITNSSTGTSSSDGSLIGQYGSNMFLWNYENGYTSFRTDNTERLRITNTGNIGIATTSPSTKLHINSSTDASLTAHGGMIIGAVNSTNVVFDNNEIIARNNGANSTLNVQLTGGLTKFGGKIQATNLGGTAATSGYADVGNVRMQWGTATSTIDAVETFNFVTSFGTCYNVQITRTGSGKSNPLCVNSKTSTKFTVDRNNTISGNQGFHWFAVGSIP